jgi:hypothetical protein
MFPVMTPNMVSTTKIHNLRPAGLLKACSGVSW